MYEGQEKIRNGDLLFVFGVWVRVGGKNEKQNIDDSANKRFPSSLPWFFFTFIILSLLVFSSFLHFFPPYFYLSFLSSLILLPWCHIMCCGMALFAFLPQKMYSTYLECHFAEAEKKGDPWEVWGRTCVFLHFYFWLNQFERQTIRETGAAVIPTGPLFYKTTPAPTHTTTPHWCLSSCSLMPLWSDWCPPGPSFNCNQCAISSAANSEAIKWPASVMALEQR